MVNLVSKLLAGWSELFNPPTSAGARPNYVPDYGWMAQIFDTISIVLYIVMGIVGAAGAIYAIWLGVQLAKADEQGKRDDAKKHLITCLIAVAVTVVLVLFFNLLLPEIVKAFMGGSVYNQYLTESGAWKPQQTTP